jgi:hypothetical protein
MSDDYDYPRYYFVSSYMRGDPALLIWDDKKKSVVLTVTSPAEMEVLQRGFEASDNQQDFLKSVVSGDESLFSFDEAAEKAWDGVVHYYEQVGENIENVVQEAAESIRAWQGVPPSEEPPEGMI